MQSNTNYYPLVQTFSSAHRQIRASANHLTSARNEQPYHQHGSYSFRKARLTKLETGKTTEESRGFFITACLSNIFTAILIGASPDFENSITWGNGTHLLPGTWPLLIPFRGSGAAPSNLE